MLTWNWLPFAELYLRLKLPERIYCQRYLVFLLSQSMQCANFYSSLQLNYTYFENQNSLWIWVPILHYLASVLFFPALSRQFCYKCLMQTGDTEEKKKKKGRFATLLLLLEIKLNAGSWVRHKKSLWSAFRIQDLHQSTAEV